jgi:hypothetical protein
MLGRCFFGANQTSVLEDQVRGVKDPDTEAINGRLSALPFAQHAIQVPFGGCGYTRRYDFANLLLFVVCAHEGQGEKPITYPANKNGLAAFSRAFNAPLPLADRNLCPEKVVKRDHGNWISVFPVRDHDDAVFRFD